MLRVVKHVEAPTYADPSEIAALDQVRTIICARITEYNRWHPSNPLVPCGAVETPEPGEEIDLEIIIDKLAQIDVKLDILSDLNFNIEHLVDTINFKLGDIINNINTVVLGIGEGGMDDTRIVERLDTLIKNLSEEDYEEPPTSAYNRKPISTLAALKSVYMMINAFRSEFATLTVGYLGTDDRISKVVPIIDVTTIR